MKTSLCVLAITALSIGAAYAGPTNEGSKASIEPYHAPDPQYTPMKSEPVLPKVKYEQPSLHPADNDHPAQTAPLEPYSAPDPSY